MAYFTDETILAVWNLAKTVEGYNPDIWRQDFAGAWIRRDRYGKREKFGWEIDHVKPISQGGTEDMDNLLPMHWRNNVAKSDHYPAFESHMSSNGTVNVEIHKSWQVRE